MPPPEVWGPAVWTLFHTLSEKINENAYPRVFPQLFSQFQKICKYLPCPECSRDATIFLAKVQLKNLKNKNDFKNLFYLFHNYVNVKKRKPLFNYGNILVYRKYRIINVINKFIAVYNTKGNMKLLTESFQRQFVLNDFKKWITAYLGAFLPCRVPTSVSETNEDPSNNLVSDVSQNVTEENNQVFEEFVLERFEKPVLQVEEKEVVEEEKQEVEEEKQEQEEEKQEVEEEKQVQLEEKQEQVQEKEVQLEEEEKVEEEVQLEEPVLEEPEPALQNPIVPDCCSCGTCCAIDDLIGLENVDISLESSVYISEKEASNLISEESTREERESEERESEERASEESTSEKSDGTENNDESKENDNKKRKKRNKKRV